MFGLFAKRTVIERWTFYGAPDEAGALRVVREGTHPDWLDSIWMFSLAVSKTLFNISDRDFTMLVVDMFSSYADELALLVKVEQRNDIELRDVLVTKPTLLNIGAPDANADMSAHRRYVYEFTRGGPRENAVLQTQWPPHYAQLDAVSMFRTLASAWITRMAAETHASTAGACFALLLRGISQVYGYAPELASKVDSILQVPKIVTDKTLGTVIELLRHSSAE